jgi:hypothetical protein
MYLLYTCTKQCQRARHLGSIKIKILVKEAIQFKLLKLASNMLGLLDVLIVLNLLL